MKTVVITGASSGIGLATAKMLEKSGYNQIWLVRDLNKARKIIAEIKPNREITLIRCDLSDLQSVKQAAAELELITTSIDVLLNNAGGIVQEKQVSVNGFEMSFAMNHLGHFLLLKILLPTLIRNNARVIHVSSEAHRAGKLNFEDLAERHNYAAFKAYADVKLCNIYTAKELHRRHHKDGIRSYSLHPGVVKTGFGSESKGIFKVMLNTFKPFMIPPEKGAQTSFYLCTADHIDHYSGHYFKKSKPVKPSTEALREDEAEKLWNYSEKLVEPFLGS